MVEQIKMTEIPHHTLGRFTSPGYIYATPIGQDRMIIQEAGFTCQIGPKGVADKRRKNDQSWDNPIIRLSDGRMVAITGSGNYDNGPEIWATVLTPEGDIPSDKVAGSNYSGGFFQWDDEIRGRTVNSNGGFVQIFNKYWLSSYWQSLPPTVSITCYLWYKRAWLDLNNPNTVYWVGKVEGLDHQYYPSWYSYGATYLFRFFIDPTDNSITADSSFVVQLGNFWEGSSGGSDGAWGPGEAGPLTNNLFWVRQRFSEDIGGPSYDNHETIRVFDYSGNQVFETADLYPYTYEYANDYDYMAGDSIIRRGSDGTIVVALQRYHSHESPPPYIYSGYMYETWLEMERWEWNGSALVRTQSKSLSYTYALDQAYYWDLNEWKPGWWAVTIDECLSPPIPYGDPAYGIEDTGRALSLLIMDNNFNTTHKWTAPTILSSDDINDNEDERLNYTAWSWTVISPMITPQGNGIFGWEWQDEWGPNALYDPIVQLYHFSLYDEGEQIIDPVWGKHEGKLAWTAPKPAYPENDPNPVKSKGADPWDDESYDTYTYSGYYDDWYSRIHYAEVGLPAGRDSLLDVVGLKLSITVQNTAPTLVHWQWYMNQLSTSDDGSSLNFGDASIPLGPSEIQTYTEIYSDHIMRNVDYDGVYWPRVMVPDPTDYNNNGWTLPDGPYIGHSGWWGGEWGGYAPATFAEMKWILMNQGAGLEISPDLGYDNEDPNFDLSSYQFRVLNVKFELIVGNQPKRATYINKASTGTAPNWVNVCPVEGVATAYPVTIQQAGAYAEIAGTGSIWYDGSDDTYAIVGTINNSLSRLEVQIPPTPAFTSTSAVTLHLRAEANHTTSTGVQMIFAMYSQPWDGNGTGFLGSFRTGTSSFAFIPEGGIQNMTLTMANFYDSAIYSALQAGGVYLYAYGSTTGTTNYWVKIYEAQVYVNGEAVAPEIVGASGADNRLNIGDDATQDWRPMHFDWTGGGFNKWQPIRFNVATDGGQDWYVACPHAYGWE